MRYTKHIKTTTKKKLQLCQTEHTFNLILLMYFEHNVLSSTKIDKHTFSPRRRHESPLTASRSVYQT